MLDKKNPPKNTLRFPPKYSEFPIYDINPFPVDYYYIRINIF